MACPTKEEMEAATQTAFALLKASLPCEVSQHMDAFEARVYAMGFAEGSKWASDIYQECLKPLPSMQELEGMDEGEFNKRNPDA